MHVSSPIGTRLGFTEAGIERAHCHHSPVSSANCRGGKPGADTTFIGSALSALAIAFDASNNAAEARIVLSGFTTKPSLQCLRYRLSVPRWWAKPYGNLNDKRQN